LVAVFFAGHARASGGAIDCHLLTQLSSNPSPLGKVSTYLPPVLCCVKAGV
jgi:hypothetical protein